MTGAWSLTLQFKIQKRKSQDASDAYSQADVHEIFKQKDLGTCAANRMRNRHAEPQVDQV
jgi:hypothetical protein